MILAKYITDLLYRHDCVIVPDFGGFVTNRIGSKIDNETFSFTAPTKQISFNSLLKHNDGLLANYIAATENISFEKATTAISLSVIKWQNELQSKEVTIDNLGKLKLSATNKIIFEPNLKVNFLTSSFGLSAVTSPEIIRTNKKIIPLNTVKSNNETKKSLPTFIKVAATAAILLTLSYAGYNGYQVNKQTEVLALQEQEIQKKIQSATFVISNPLPTISLNVAKKTEEKYHVIAGAFQIKENAEKKVSQLISKGYNAKIIGINNWGLTQVSFHSFSDRNEATNFLYRIQKTVSKDAWLLIKDK